MSLVSDLEDAEAVIAAMDKVNAIGKVEYNDDSKALIETARAEYNSLTAKQKALFPASAFDTLETAEETYATTEKNANTISTVFLIISIILLIAGIIVMILLLRKRNDNKKNGGTKVMSVAGLLMLLAATSHYFDAKFIVLYVLAFLTLAVWVANLVIFLNMRKKGKAVKEEKAPTEENAE